MTSQSTEGLRIPKQLLIRKTWGGGRGEVDWSKKADRVDDGAILKISRYYKSLVLIKKHLRSQPHILTHTHADTHTCKTPKIDV